LACREGLSLAADPLLQHLRVDTDCSNVLRSIEDDGIGTYVHIVKEIKARRRDFSMFQFVHKGISSNVNLARSSLYLNFGRHVWFQLPPEGVCSSYVNTI
jgi:hypothetical protein